ncbi:MAG TPA: ABC transporter ATP-binding protein [Stellaceae bacterium]|nr:ABC transporter ATP-binding protein [Stellaceae bacterium]
MSEALLAIDGLGVAVRGAATLDGVSLTVGEGEVVALLGANGAGKSTLLKAIMGLLPSRGAIRLGGAEINRLAPARRARSGLGYVPEGRRLFPGMSVRDTLLVGSRASGRRAAEHLAGVLELFPDLRPRLAIPAWQLSGGQQQMLAIGRALMGAPRLLLLDEPSLGLAPMLVDELLARMRGLAAAGVGVLLAEQSVARALGVASRVYALAQGRIVAQGPAAELRRSPVLERAFLGADVALSSPSRISQPESDR